MEIKEPYGGWEKLWVEGKTLWDLGEATPIVVQLSETGSLPNGRALGYDVVVGLDLSKTSVERSTKMFSSLSNAKHFSFLEEDFFTWEPTEKFDLIFDYKYTSFLL
ncbi:putative methyl halide transferase [Arabidopsis thaliana]